MQNVYEVHTTMKVTDLFNLELKTLQKKYGGSIKNDTWLLHPRLLGLTPIEISVYRGEEADSPLVSVHWDKLLLIMNRELHIEPETTPSKLRWFMKYLELFDPELKDASPHLFQEAEEHAKKWDSIWKREGTSDEQTVKNRTD